MILLALIILVLSSGRLTYISILSNANLEFISFPSCLSFQVFYPWMVLQYLESVNFQPWKFYIGAYPRVALYCEISCRTELPTLLEALLNDNTNYQRVLLGLDLIQFIQICHGKNLITELRIPYYLIVQFSELCVVSVWGNPICSVPLNFLNILTPKPSFYVNFSLNYRNFRHFNQIHLF